MKHSTVCHITRTSDDERCCTPAPRLILVVRVKGAMLRVPLPRCARTSRRRRVVRIDGLYACNVSAGGTAAGAAALRLTWQCVMAYSSRSCMTASEL